MIAFFAKTSLRFRVLSGFVLLLCLIGAVSFLYDARVRDIQAQALVDRTGAALRDIIGKVATMDDLAREISASSKDQATGLAEINIAVSQMDQVVQQNAAMVEESTAAAYALKTETDDLTAMVGRFQIGREPGSPKARAA